MKFDFNPCKDVADALGKTAVRRFQNAKTNQVDKTWVKDVLDLFASRAHLTLPQAIMVVRTNGIEYTQKMHSVTATKLPDEVWSIDDRGQPCRIRNPEKTKLLGFAEMSPHLHAGMIREALGFAATLRHPQDPVPKGKPTQPDTKLEMSINRKSLMHPDELKSSHRRRMQIALKVALGDELLPEDLKFIGNRLGLALLDDPQPLAAE